VARDDHRRPEIPPSWGIFKIGEKTSKHFGVSPGTNPPTVAVLAGDSPDLAGLVVVVNRESSSASRHIRIGHRLAADRAPAAL
jgi:hypothetical protein